jgi:hypothetical protein
MSLVLDLPPELEAELATEAARRGLPLPEYAVRLLANWQAQGLVGAVGQATPASPEEWRRRVLATAGKWQGELERPEQGEYEQRDSLS